MTYDLAALHKNVKVHEHTEACAPTEDTPASFLRCFQAELDALREELHRERAEHPEG